MYYPDLSPYSYATEREIEGVLNVGWLERGIPYMHGFVHADAIILGSYNNAMRCRDPRQCAPT